MRVGEVEVAESVEHGRATRLFSFHLPTKEGRIRLRIVPLPPASILLTHEEAFARFCLFGAERGVPMLDRYF